MLFKITKQSKSKLSLIFTKNLKQIVLKLNRKWNYEINVIV